MVTIIMLKSDIVGNFNIFWLIHFTETESSAVNHIYGCIVTLWKQMKGLQRALKYDSRCDTFVKNESTQHKKTL